MLVLRRKVNEAIVLNKTIIIRVLSVEGDRVKLGIDAPPDVIVVREELLDENAHGTPAPRMPVMAGGVADYIPDGMVECRCGMQVQREKIYEHQTTTCPFR